MKIVNIMDLIDMDFESHSQELAEKIKAAPGYKEAQEKYLELIDSLETKTKIDIDSATTYMETLAMDIAFNEGFKLAIQLILSSIQ